MLSAGEVSDTGTGWGGSPFPGRRWGGVLSTGGGAGFWQGYVEQAGDRKSIHLHRCRHAGRFGGKRRKASFSGCFILSVK